MQLEISISLFDILNKFDNNFDNYGSDLPAPTGHRYRVGCAQYNYEFGM